MTGARRARGPCTVWLGSSRVLLRVRVWGCGGCRLTFIDLYALAVLLVLRRALDFVSRKAMERYSRRNAEPPKLVLVDQSHFAVTFPPMDMCPRVNATAGKGWMAWA